MGNHPACQFFRTAACARIVADPAARPTPAHLMDRLLEATERAERDHCWFHGFRAFVTPLLDRALAGHAAPAILDCGCGTGNNLARLPRPRGRAVGVDLAWRGLQFARPR